MSETEAEAIEAEQILYRMVHADDDNPEEWFRNAIAHARVTVPVVRGPAEVSVTSTSGQIQIP